MLVCLERNVELVVARALPLFTWVFRDGGELSVRLVKLVEQCEVARLFMESLIIFFHTVVTFLDSMNRVLCVKPADLPLLRGFMSIRHFMLNYLRFIAIL